MMVAFEVPNWVMSCCSFAPEAVSNRNMKRLHRCGDYGIAPPIVPPPSWPENPQS
jgi:hypothetical protein